MNRLVHNANDVVNRTPNGSIKIPSTKCKIKEFMEPIFKSEIHIKCKQCCNYTASLKSHTNMANHDFRLNITPSIIARFRASIHFNTQSFRACEKVKRTDVQSYKLSDVQTFRRTNVQMFDRSIKSKLHCKQI